MLCSDLKVQECPIKVDKRTDELSTRVALLQQQINNIEQNQNKLDTKIDKILGRLEEVSEKVVRMDEHNSDFHAVKSDYHNLMLRMSKVEDVANHSQSKWERLIDSIWKLALIVLTAAILAFLGLKS